MRVWNGSFFLQSIPYSIYCDQSFFLSFVQVAFRFFHQSYFLYIEFYTDIQTVVIIFAVKWTLLSLVLSLNIRLLLTQPSNPISWREVFRSSILTLIVFQFTAGQSLSFKYCEVLQRLHNLQYCSRTNFCTLYLSFWVMYIRTLTFATESKLHNNINMYSYS